MSKLKNIIKIFLEFIHEYPLEFLSLFILICLEGLIAASAVLSIAPLADYLLDPSLQSPSRLTLVFIDLAEMIGANSGFLFFATVFVFTNLLKGLLEIVVRYAILNIKYSILRGLTNRTLRLFLQARWDFFSGSDQGKLLNTFSRELPNVGDTLGHLTTQFAQFLQFLIYLVVPLWINWSMTLYAIGVVVVLATPLLLLHRLSYRLGRLNTQTGNETMGILTESLGAAKLILGFAKQSQTLSRYLKAFDRHVWATLRSQLLDVSIPAMFQPLGIIASIFAIGIGLSKGVSLPDMAAVMWALLKSMPILGSVLRSNISISNFLPSYEQLSELRNQAFSSREIQGALNFQTLDQGINFEHVSFSYPGRQATIVDVSLEISKGEMTAFVGDSGSGKSTLGDLLMGLLVPDHGQITIDEIPLTKWNRNTFREKIGFVPQDAILFNCSIRENLLWSFNQASEEELLEACRLANAKSFVEQLPRGLDTVVGDRGVRLSGGQKQRIALARALLCKPELLILDEATSALDSESERLIQSSIETLSKSSTILVIAHRLSTITKADRIYVLQAGLVKESGGFKELVDRPDSLFGGMVRFQQMAS